MSIYKKRSLADSNLKFLMTILGEYLVCIDNSVFDMNLLTDILKGKTYTARFRLLLLNPDETIDYEIPQEDIILDSGNFSENYQDGQRKNINVSLININGKYTPNINTVWIHNRFRFDIGIEHNGEIFWFPRGVYILGDPDATRGDSDKIVNLPLVDKFAIFEGTSGTLDTTYEIPQGTLIKDAIQSLLTLDNGSGYPLDLKPIVYDALFEGKVTPYTLRKDAGAEIAELLLDLALMLNAECFYNSLGNLCFININDTTSDFIKTVLWDYSDKEAEYLDSSMSFDFKNVVNVVQVVGDNINGDIFSATSKNQNPESPICIQRIGKRTKYINDSNIYSDVLAQQRANYELRRLSILKTTITIQVTFNPLLFVNNLITLSDDYWGFDKERFLIQSISYNIGDDNKMTITCSNVANYISEDIKSMSVQSPMLSLTSYFKGFKQLDNNISTIRFYFYRRNNLSDDWIVYNTVDINGGSSSDWDESISTLHPWYIGRNKIAVATTPSVTNIPDLSLSVKDTLVGANINELVHLTNLTSMGIYTPIIETNEFMVTESIVDMRVSASIYSGGIACLDENTLIRKSDENIMIKNLQIGDFVLDKDYNETIITDIISHQEYNIIEFTLENNDKIIANNQHKFLMGNVFVNTDNIIYFTTADGKIINIKDKQYIIENRTVYEIITEAQTYQLYNGIVCECEQIDKVV